MYDYKIIYNISVVVGHIAMQRIIFIDKKGIKLLQKQRFHFVRIQQQLL